MNYYYSYYSTWIYLLPAIIITIYAQVKIKSAYSRYSGIRNTGHFTGAQAAAMILESQGISGVSIVPAYGQLTDNYNPANRTLNLSQGVYNSDSIAAICIAAHECGHACQHKEGYSLLRFRNAIVPAANIGSSLAWPLLILGLFIGSTGLFNIGILLFSLVVIFHLVTLPVELNASSRALKMMQNLHIVRSEEDLRGSKAVLSAAALTYLGSLAMAVANLLRILAMRDRR